MPEERLIAIAAEDDRGLDGQVARHFDHCPFYVLAETHGDVVAGSLVVMNPYCGANEPRVMVRFLRGLGVDVVIAGGMGRRALDRILNSGMDVVLGGTGTVAAVLRDYVLGRHSGVMVSPHDEYAGCVGYARQMAN